MWDSSPRAARGARFQSNVLTTRIRVGILIGNQNWSKQSRSGDVQPEIKLPWPWLPVWKSDAGVKRSTDRPDGCDPVPKEVLHDRILGRVT